MSSRFKNCSEDRRPRTVPLQLKYNSDPRISNYEEQQDKKIVRKVSQAGVVMKRSGIIIHHH